MCVPNWTVCTSIVKILERNCPTFTSSFFASIIAYLFLDSQLTKLLHYPLTLEIWGAIYWIISIVATAEEVKILNRENATDDEVYFNLRQSPVEKWLQNNPGKSINDYYKYN